MQQITDHADEDKVTSLSTSRKLLAINHGTCHKNESGYKHDQVSGNKKIALYSQPKMHSNFLMYERRQSNVCNGGKSDKSSFILTHMHRPTEEPEVQ